MDENDIREAKMDWFVKAFIRASLVWLLLGVSMGVAMAVNPAWVVYRPAHVHMNVVGFMTMMIFGVGYQLLPRLFGHPLRNRAVAVAHWWLANIGLAGMVTGFLLRPHFVSVGVPVTAAGGSLFALGAFGFVHNMWRTFDMADARIRARAASQPSRPLPMMAD